MPRLAEELRVLHASHETVCLKWAMREGTASRLVPRRRRPAFTNTWQSDRERPTQPISPARASQVLSRFGLRMHFHDRTA